MEIEGRKYTLVVTSANDFDTLSLECTLDNELIIEAELVSYKAKFAQRAKNVKLALNSKITHLNSRSQSALASNILVQHIEQPMHRYLFLRLMD